MEDYAYDLAKAVQNLTPESHDSHLYALEARISINFLDNLGQIVTTYTVTQKGNAHVTHFAQFCSSTTNMPFATVLCVAL